MSNQGALEQIQKCADYRAAQRLLRKDAYGSFLFGAWGLFLGFKGLQDTSLNLVLMLIGAFLVAGGIVALVRPGAGAVGLAGVGMMLVGLWNLLISLAGVIAGDPGSVVIWLILGVFQVIWGAKMLGPKSRMSALMLSQPPAEALSREVDAIVNGVLAAREGSGEEYVEFTTKSFFGGTASFVGKLGDGTAVFVDRTGTRIYCAAAGDLGIAPFKERIKPKNNKASLRLKGETLPVLISEASLIRLSGWTDTCAGVAPVGMSVGAEQSA